MKKFLLLLSAINFTTYVFAQLNSDTIPPRATVANGMLEGTNESGIHTFKGIPYAAPPVGNLRWREPQPMTNWTGVRKAYAFGPRAMQLPLFGDMNFRSDGISEDCLYLNIWTPSKSGNEKLPVLVYFYGGGLMAGDASEPRYDGESMARRGIVSVTVNYRLTVFGFFSHPELTKESPHHASGNQGFLDEAAALQWVQQNIGAFGGDPKRVTIAGESAGSFSVSAQMASPLSKKLFNGAIGESGSLLGFTPLVSLSNGEKTGVQFTESLGAKSLAELRAMPAEKILQATTSAGFERFPITVDGYFFTKQPIAVYEAGEQAQVPLLVGWNSEESSYRGLLGDEAPTVENYTKAVQKKAGNDAAALLAAYPAATDADVIETATKLASDYFIGYSTWQWSDVQTRTSKKPVYRYLYAHPRPQMRSEMGNAKAGLAGGIMKDTTGIKETPPATGAVHSAEIEYALGNLATNNVYDWQPADAEVSNIMQAFFVNFITTGNPNGLGVPAWQPVERNKPASLMRIDVNTKAVIEKHRDQYLLMQTMSAGKK